MKVKVHFPSEDQIVQSFGLEEGGDVQLFFTNEVMRLSDDYIPMNSGNLKNNTSVKSDRTGYTYESIYAQYQWYGKLMVDPITLKGSFFSPRYGHWSRPNTPKIMDPQGRDLNNTNGLRGPYWTERMWADRGDEIISSLNKFIKTKGGRQ